MRAGAIALIALATAPTASCAHFEAIHVSHRRGPAPPILTRSGYSVNPLELHKLARKNRRKRR